MFMPCYCNLTPNLKNLSCTPEMGYLGHCYCYAEFHPRKKLGRRFLVQPSDVYNKKNLFILCLCLKSLTITRFEKSEYIVKFGSELL